ncbi:MAG: tyrosine-type recombinase/integrase [Steroidobacteraceae bacterium]
MVQIIRKAGLPSPAEVPAALRLAAASAPAVVLREPRPAGFPLLFTADLELIEPAVAFLHEHAVQRAHTTDTLRTYAELLYDWFETLEQNCIGWHSADAADLVAYRNRMLTQPSAHTKRAYSIRTINHRVRGVLRFYAWAVRARWLQSSSLVGRGNDFGIARQARAPRRCPEEADTNLFVLRQFVDLPRPLTTAQARELLATLAPPYDLMARWQLYTGLRVSELLRLTAAALCKASATAEAGPQHTHQVIDVLRKGRKNGYVIAPASLLEETTGYLSTHRRSWLARAVRAGRAEPAALFANSRGRQVTQNHYQRVIHRAGLACGFRATTHLLRATFACMMLARLEQLAREDAAINPLLIVKVLMAHEHIETTDRYLRAIAVDQCALSDVIDSLLEGAQC